MVEESFLLVNLKEDKAKKLAQVLSNDSCRKILEFLTDNKSGTETEISEKLKIPLSTVHYNLNHLSKAGLVKNEDYHYSKKGREVIHYTLANKYIVIAPSEDKSFAEKLKKILPFGIISIIGTVSLYIYQNINKVATFSAKSEMMQPRAFAVDVMVAESSNVVKSEPNLALWFFMGTLLIILSMLVVEFIKDKKINN
ncbi:MAG: ArsR/SmtB family transcription factor [Nanoarchaeota archaeon]